MLGFAMLEDIHTHCMHVSVDIDVNEQGSCHQSSSLKARFKEDISYLL